MVYIAYMVLRKLFQQYSGYAQIFLTQVNCVCVKRIALCSCLCSSFPSRFSSSLIRNNGELGAKTYFTDHRTNNTIQLFVPIKKKFFGSILFQNKPQRKRIPQRLLDKYSIRFIYISLKQTLSSGLEPVYSVKILLLSKQIAFSAVLYFGQAFFFCRLINKSVLEWFLLIIYKQHILSRSTNLFSRNHLTSCL